MVPSIRNLPEGRAGDAGGLVNIIDQPGHVIEDHWEVRIELSRHGRGPRTGSWRFDLYLIHYWDVGRMPAV